MPATVTLSSTTLKTAAGASDKQIQVSSTSGLIPGIHLFADGELMSVVSLGIGTWVNVLRGVGGSAATAHPAMATVYVGRADQFYSTDPVGKPAASVLVSPWINVRNGAVWFAQGDPDGVRWWQKQEAAHSAGPLGIQAVALDPSAST